jgi:phenylalanyl-tRNA synthetase beta chain
MLQWGRKDDGVDFFDVKGDVQALLAPIEAQFIPGLHPAMHPGRCAQVLVDQRPIGFVGELHPRWRSMFDLAHAPVLFELDLAPVLQRSVAAFKPVSKLQPVQRDIAMVVDDHVTHDALMAAIWTEPKDGVLRDAQLFDVYRPKTNKDASMAPPSERSLAVRLTLNSDEATLTEERIESVVSGVVERLVTSLGARQRV